MNKDLEKHKSSNRVMDLFDFSATDEYTVFRIYPKTIYLRDIERKMEEFIDELKKSPKVVDLTSIEIKKYIAEWSYYLFVMSKMKNTPGKTKNMHYIANMHLRNFGLNSANKNSEVKSLFFYETAFNRSQLFMAKDASFSKNGKEFYIEKGYPLHMEVLFGKVEKYLADCLNQYIPKDISKTEKSIYTATKEQSNLVNLRDSLYFKILLSTYIFICGFRKSFQGKANYDIIQHKFSDTAVIHNSIESLIYRNWIFAYADNGEELSITSRGIIPFPEFDDALFFSISRVWGIWITSTKDSKKIKDSFKVKYFPDTVKSIESIGKSLGHKWNVYMSHDSTDKEYFYPHAKKLSFRPDYNLLMPLSISKKELAARKHRLKNKKNNKC